MSIRTAYPVVIVLLLCAVGCAATSGQMGGPESAEGFIGLFELVAEIIAIGIETLGIGIITKGAITAALAFVQDWFSSVRVLEVCYDYRVQMGQAILLGLEFLVAADIIRTVAVRPTFTSVGILAAIVAIRTFLSFTLEIEIEGRLPWRSDKT